VIQFLAVEQDASMIRCRVDTPLVVVCLFVVTGYDDVR
jgi:hypothetical protein